MMHSLFPQTWEHAPLGDLIVLALGGDWGQAPDYKEEGYVDVRCIRASEFRDWNTDRGLTAALRRITHSSLTSRQLKRGDIIVEISGGGPEQPVGRTLLIDDTALRKHPHTPKVCSNFCRLARPTPHIDAAYLNYFLAYFYQTGRTAGYQGGSNNLRNLRFDDFLTISVPLAPISEQQRIVARIEELLSELDAGLQNLRTAARQCHVYRQAILNEAFSNVVADRRLPELLAEPMSNGYSGKPVPRVTPWRVLSLSATTTGVFSDRYFKYLDEPGLEGRNIWCEPGDVLVQRGNTAEYVGVPALYTGRSGAFIFPDLMIRLRADRAVIVPEYLCYALAAPRLRNEMRRKARGSAGTMPKISQKILSEIRLPYCDLDTQRRVVEHIDAADSGAKALQESLATEMCRADALRCSILQQAFGGGLLEQQPNDEPASALLERIRRDRAAATEMPKRPGKKRISAA